jgi:monofunctional biosynthetic peptidoglycan transglycosylase
VQIDFTDNQEAQCWSVVNDGVMGGISQGSIEPAQNGTAIFSGRLSLENNGGFASIRRPIDRASLKGFSGIILKVKGDGRSYQFRVRTDGQYDGIAYRALFATDNQAWQSITLFFDRFSASYRGRSVPGAPVLSAEAIEQIGLLIADKQPGPFRLEIAEIKAF